MATKLILPILNKNATTFKGPTWYLAESIAVEAISPEDHGVILSNAGAEISSLIGKKSKCIRIQNVDPAKAENVAQTEAAKTSFVLNYFRHECPVALAFALQITKERKARLDRVMDLYVATDMHAHRTNNYRVEGGISRGTISEFYKVVSKAHANHEGLLLTLRRFNCALCRKEPEDKIVDVTISLESLISGTTEMRHKFATYNAWAAEPDQTKREKAFDLLQKLYDARSAIVHGAAMKKKEHRKKIGSVLSAWDDIVSVASRAIAYHVLFLYSARLGAWHEHQQQLALGLAQRIEL